MRIITTLISATIVLTGSHTTFTKQENLMTKTTFAAELYKIGAIQFGDFTLSSGMKSPYYIDLRKLISFPHLLKAATDLLWQEIKECSFDYITGVPYAALPFATSLAVIHAIPMIMPRKDIKTHGTRQRIEGVFDPGKTCLLIEDLFTTGNSSLETIIVLEQNGLLVTDIAILLDREQGGKQQIEKKGYRVHALFSMSELANILCNLNLIDAERADAIRCYSRENHITY